jgi:four helix bundle protein
MRVADYKELRVYRLAFDSAMEIFKLSKEFPPEEKFSLTDQIRRSSRSVCTNLAEAWRRRRYEAAFVSKLSDSDGEAAETEVHLDFALHCAYLPADRHAKLREMPTGEFVGVPERPCAEPQPTSYAARSRRPRRS